MVDLIQEVQEIEKQTPYAEVFIRVPNSQKPGEFLYQQGFEITQPDEPLSLFLLTSLIDHQRTPTTITNLYIALENGIIFQLGAIPGDGVVPTRWWVESSSRPGKPLGVDPGSNFQVGKPINFSEVDDSTNKIVAREISTITKIVALQDAAEITEAELKGRLTDISEQHKQLRRAASAR